MRSMLKRYSPLGLGFCLLAISSSCSTPPSSSSFVGKRAPTFTLKSLEGKSVQLTDFHGKAVLLDFWASWCQPCREELPVIQKIHEDLGDRGLVVVSVNLESEELARPVVKEDKLTYIVVVDADGKVAEQYQVDPIPRVVIIDREGKVVADLAGATPEEDLRAAIKKAGVE